MDLFGGRELLQVENPARDQTSAMLIGIDHRMIAHRGLAPEQVLELVRDRRLDGVRFREPGEIDRAGDARRLARFRERAEDLGLYLEVGLPSPNPIRRGQLEGRTISPGEHARDLGRALEAIAALGCRTCGTFVGDPRHDRFRTAPDRAAQQEATLEVLRLLGPALRSLGLRLAIENHADLTTEELLRLVGAADDDRVGIALNTGFLLMQLDDPIRATQRLAPRVLSVHVQDAVLAFSDRGLRWQARPAGSGVLPLTELLACVERVNPGVNVSIELDPGIHDLPIFDPSWLAFFPDLKPADLAEVVRLAVESERRFRDGSLERPEVIEAVAWDQRDLDGLARSAGFLRPIAHLLGSL